MKRTFLLEGERITLRRAKELCGEQYERVMREVKAAFLADPRVELSYMTRVGILTIWFRVE